MLSSNNKVSTQHLLCSLELYFVQFKFISAYFLQDFSRCSFSKFRPPCLVYLTRAHCGRSLKSQFMAILPFQFRPILPQSHIEANWLTSLILRPIDRPTAAQFRLRKWQIVKSVLNQIDCNQSDFLNVIFLHKPNFRKKKKI